MTSDRAWRWRVSELGDDERQSWEMTEGTRRRWRVWQSRDDECEEVVDTSKRERRWRKGRRGVDECEAIADTSKRERRWRKRVLWDDVELCGKFYEWDPVGCIGETTPLLQHVISKKLTLITSKSTSSTSVCRHRRHRRTDVDDIDSEVVEEGQRRSWRRGNDGKGVVK